MRFRDLVQWIGSQGVAVEERYMKKDKALVFAQKIWDAAGNGIMDKMKKRMPSFYNNVKIPQVREDFQQMTKKDLQQ